MSLLFLTVFIRPYVIITLEFVCLWRHSGRVFNYNFEMGNLEVHRLFSSTTVLLRTEKHEREKWKMCFAGTLVSWKMGKKRKQTNMLSNIWNIIWHWIWKFHKRFMVFFPSLVIDVFLVSLFLFICRLFFTRTEPTTALQGLLPRKQTLF